MKAQQLKKDWLSNIRMDILSGITVALALIPEAIAFSIIARVDPQVGLYASFCIAIIISIVGGRPGMISAATGAMALVMVTLVAQHGLQYMLAATILTGVIQMIMGLLKLGKFMSFVPQSVIYGFVNALGIMIFMAQLTHFVGQTWSMYLMVLITLIIIYAVPRFTKAVPSPLIAIVLMTAAAMMFGLKGNTVGDMGEIPNAFPIFLLPDIPLNLDTLMIILPYSITLAIVGTLESLLTASILDDMTNTKSNKNTEIRGQGIANTITGFFGGMAGCAMVGQSVINIKSGGRGRLSTFVAGIFLLFLILVLGDLVRQIPMAAIVGVMFMVAASTFNWESVRNIMRIPFSDTLVMVVTVSVVLYTHDLAKGVLAGVLLSAVIFGWKMAKIKINTSVDEVQEEKHYYIRGQLFFATVQSFSDAFDFKQDPSKIVIHFDQSHVWDQSAVGAISKVLVKYRLEDKKVYLHGFNKESEKLVNRMGLSRESGH